MLAAVAATGPDAAAVVADALVCRACCPGALVAAARALAPAARAALVLRLAARPAAARWLRAALGSGGSSARDAAAVRAQLLDAALAGPPGGASVRALRALVAWHCSPLQQDATADEVQRVAAHAQRPGVAPAAALLCAALLLAAPRAPPDAVAALVRHALREGTSGGTSEGDDPLAAHALLLCCVAHRCHAADAAAAVAPRVAAFLADVCGVPVVVAPRALQHVLDAVRRDGPSERACCERATAAAAAPAAPLALLAVDTLLAAHAFARSGVPVRPWLAAQVRAAAHPVPPLLPRLLRRYHARSPGGAAPGAAAAEPLPLLDEAAVRTALGMPPPPPCRTRGIIPVPVDAEVPAPAAASTGTGTDTPRSSGSAAPALALYCVLLASEHGAPPPPPADLLWELPVEAVLAQLRTRDPRDSSGLCAALEHLIASQMPYAAPDPLLQEEEEDEEEDDKQEKQGEELQTVLAELETLVLRLPCAGERECAALARRWHRHYARAPWATARATARVLCVRTPGGGAPAAADLVADPLAVLCVRTPHIVRTPALVAVLLAVLASVLHANHRALQDAAAATAATAAPDEGLALLPLVQDSALVQALLELLLPAHRALPPFASARARRGVQARVCAFVHALFLADPLLIRAVHTQGYDARLVRVLVRRVPSLHVCLDWLPELLAPPAGAARQLFAVRLAAALVARHRTPRSLAVAEHVLARLRAYATAPTPDASRFLAAALPALAPLCTAFPALAPPAAALVAALRALVARDPDAADAALADTLVRVAARLPPSSPPAAQP